jgi:hypothetical protein
MKAQNSYYQHLVLRNVLQRKEMKMQAAGNKLRRKNEKRPGSPVGRRVWRQAMNLVGLESVICPLTF